MAASFPKSPFRSVRRWLWVILIFGCCLVVVYALKSPPPSGQEITFKNAIPQLSPVVTAHSEPPEWLTKTHLALDALKGKVTKLSSAPKTTPQLEQSVEFWYQKLLLRYPELAVPMRTIPDAQNGFLQLLNLMDRLKGKDELPPFPAAIIDYLQQKGPWPSEVAQKWLMDNQARVAEIHTIGLLADRSVNGISKDRWFFIPATPLKKFNDILMLEARHAADLGETGAALEAVRAARGLADHLSEIESPTFLMATVKILNRWNLEKHVLTEILPALPADRLDIAVWETTVNATTSGPNEYSRLIKGEWHAGMRNFLLPSLLNPTSIEHFSDAGELLDFYSLRCAEVCRTFEGATMRDMATLTTPPIRDVSHLSATSHKFVEVMMIGTDSWLKGWISTQSKAAMTRAAFAIMKGQPIPQDPIYGLDYGWDPATRQLSFPAGAPGKHDIPPITVPKIGPVVSP